MKLSAETINVLKNFAAINSNIVIKPGNQLLTMAEAKNVIAQATVSEMFTNEVGIYDLREFLSAISVVDDPTIKFEDKYMAITSNSGRTSMKYYNADIEILTTPSKAPVMPSVDVSFTLDQGTLASLKQAASVFGHTMLTVEPNNQSIKLAVVDPDNATANEFSIDVDGEYPEDTPFKFILFINNLKMIPGDYKVNISAKLISEFISSDGRLHYWAALEKSSTYGE